MDTSTMEYTRAFEAYMRYGTPVRLSLKQARPTSHYIWRTRGDSRVRSSHAAGNGRVFAWNDPPPGGHPGEDYGCRCTAEPTRYTDDAHRTFEEVIKIHEGGYSNRSDDRGGETNYGITIDTWNEYAEKLFGIKPGVQTLEKITPAMANEIFRTGYWKPSRVDELNDIELARLHSDTVYLTGGGNAARIFQRAINRAGGRISVDGVVGSRTLEAANSLDPATLYNAYKAERWKYHKKDLEANPDQETNRNGWKNRLDSFRAYD